MQSKRTEQEYTSIQECIQVVHSEGMYTTVALPRRAYFTVPGIRVFLFFFVLNALRCDLGVGTAPIER